MPINSEHPEYEANKEVWDKCIDFYNGEEDVKKAGKKYVPGLSGQNTAKYNAYIKRAPFFGSVSRTVSALTGAVFRKPPAMDLPSSVEYLKKDATGTGMSLTEVAIALSVEIMKTGRAGLHVDIPTDGGLPYLALYEAKTIKNWDTDTEDPFVVLEEVQYIKDPKDKFQLTPKTQYRELKIEEGSYKVALWEKEGKSNKYKETSIFEPLSRGRTMDVMPFCVVSPTGLDFGVDRPPILDMVNALAAWWRVSVDHANAIHTICVPTPVVSADVEADKFELKLGPDSCLLLPVGSKAEFLEFKAGGLKEVSAQLERLMDMQAALGARLISNTGNKTLIETAEGARIRESMSTAILGSVVASVEAALMKAVDWAANWIAVDQKPSDIKLNKELISTSIDANMVNSLLKAVLEDKLSFESFYRALEEAGMTDPGVSAENEMKRIKTEMLDKKKFEEDNELNEDDKVISDPTETESTS